MDNPALTEALAATSLDLNYAAQQMREMAQELQSLADEVNKVKIMQAIGEDETPSGNYRYLPTNVARAAEKALDVRKVSGHLFSAMRSAQDAVTAAQKESE